MGGNTPKQFLELSGRSILGLTLDGLARSGLLSEIYLVVPADFTGPARSLAAETAFAHPGLAVTVVEGGAERQDSVFNGLLRVPEDCEYVMIHDGVRPFASRRLMEETFLAARKTGAAVAAIPATDTVKRGAGGYVVETLVREELWMIQTPQMFRTKVILEAYREAAACEWKGTDDASFVERAGGKGSLVMGARTNITVTTPEDLDWAAWFFPRGREGGKE